MEPFGQSHKKLCHAHLHVIGIMCSKFHQDDLKTMGGV